jgi:hypothetical protein
VTDLTIDNPPTHRVRDVICRVAANPCAPCALLVSCSYGLSEHFALNIEPNHTTLAGHVRASAPSFHMLIYSLFVCRSDV